MQRFDTPDSNIDGLSRFELKLKFPSEMDPAMQVLMRGALMLHVFENQGLEFDQISTSYELIAKDGKQYWQATVQYTREKKFSPTAKDLGKMQITIGPVGEEKPTTDVKDLNESPFDVVR